jgi:hypothetical protein
MHVNTLFSRCDMISVSILKAAGLSDTQALRVIELEQQERASNRKEQNRINQQNHRARKRVSADLLTQKEIPPTPPKEKLPFLLSSTEEPLTSETSRREGVSVAGQQLLGWPANYRELFWAAYPLKVAKRAGLKALEAATKRTTFDALMAGLERYKATQNPQFYCHPATWLNQERWLDEPMKFNGNGMGAMVELERRPGVRG